MTLEQSTAAALSEIDRTLRSLAIRDDAFCAHLTPPLTYASPFSVPDVPVRNSSCVQTPAVARVVASTQSCSVKCTAGVQHVPHRQTAGSQTDTVAEDKNVVLSLHSTASLLASMLESSALLERNVSQRRCELDQRLETIGFKVQSLLFHQRECESYLRLRVLENKELTERSELLNTESAFRHDLILNYFACGRSIENAAQNCLSNDLEMQPVKAVNAVSQLKDRGHSESSSNCSLNDLTDLLDECWRVLDE